MCGERRQRWRCGDDARRALARAIAGKSLVCRPRGEAESGQLLGQCFAGEADIGADLVKGGQAWADRDDTLGYRALETAPKSARLGIWKAVSEPAWVFRARLWEDAQRAAPDGCPIKAERVGEARIYHLPWSPGYQGVRVARSDLARNAKQWFCSEREAREAGYKPATERR